MGADHIADWTASDPVLQQVLRRVHHCWGDKCPDKSLDCLLFEKRRTKHTQWMYFVGKPCGHSSKGPTSASGGLAQHSSRDSQNEKSGALLPMVGGVG